MNSQTEAIGSEEDEEIEEEEVSQRILEDVAEPDVSEDTIGIIVSSVSVLLSLVYAVVVYKKWTNSVCIQSR